jgi:hypothetical protein
VGGVIVRDVTPFTQMVGRATDEAALAAAPPQAAPGPQQRVQAQAPPKQAPGPQAAPPPAGKVPPPPQRASPPPPPK